MVVRLTKLQKRRGGRLRHVDTFVTQCNAKIKEDARWNIAKTLQSVDQSNDVDAFVGVSNDLHPNGFVVKVMEDSGYALREQKIQRHFHKHPHQHVIQTICSFKCNDNLQRWLMPVKNQQLCNYGSSRVFVMVQDYIQRGNLHGFVISNLLTWKTILYQLTYGYIELFTMHGLLFNDWHSGNVLIDTTGDKHMIYECFGDTVQIDVVDSICPVITDFSRSSLHNPKKLELWQLGDQISMIWDMMKHKCPDHVTRSKLLTLIHEIPSCDTQIKLKEVLQQLHCV